MRAIFVKTVNAQRFLSGLKALEQRGADEACLMVLDGEPGLGKSATVKWWSTQHQAVFLRAKKEWTPGWLLRELLQSLNKTPEYSFERMFRQAIQALSDYSVAAARDGRQAGLVFDEVDHMSRSAKLLETVRDITDMTEIPCILVGMGRVRHHLTRFPQVASRVGQYVEFAAGGVADTKAMVEGLSEVPVKDDLISLLHEVSRGRFREIKEGIAAIEHFGRRNGGKPVGCADMAGLALLNDRTSGKPIVIRG